MNDTPDLPREFAAFPRYEDPGEKGFFFDFLGNRTRTDYFGEFIKPYDGAVLGYPTPTACLFHEYPEWIGALRSVLEARDRFVGLELGAGWAPWSVSMLTAARKRGISDVRAVAVEAAGSHVDYAVRHIADNGFTESEIQIIHGAAGGQDGEISFPKLADPKMDYGASINDAPSGETETVPLFSIATLLEPFDRVDLIHCDIQGAEADVLAQCIDAVTAKVRRVVVGTHSTEIDRQLPDIFRRAGWEAESVEPCKTQASDGREVLLTDGTQVWVNPSLGYDGTG